MGPKKHARSFAACRSHTMSPAHNVAPTQRMRTRNIHVTNQNEVKSKQKVTSRVKQGFISFWVFIVGGMLTNILFFPFQLY